MLWSYKNKFCAQSKGVFRILILEGLSPQRGGGGGGVYYLFIYYDMSVESCFQLRELKHAF